MINRAAALFRLAFVFLLPAGCKHAPDKPQQSELLKALEIRPEDILDVYKRQVIARQLKTAVKICGRSRSDYYQYVDQNTVMRVAIRSRGVTHVRNIPMRDEDMETLAKPLADIEEYRRIYQQLPRLGQNSTTVSIGRTTLSDSSLRELYNTLCDEVASMPFEKWYPLILSLIHI